MNLEESQALLAAIVESTGDAIVSSDLAGVILTWNAGAERLFGYTAGEAIGRSMPLLLPADRRGEEHAILARLAAGERIDHFETQRVTKSGSVVDVSVTASPVRDAAGRTVGASMILRDVTDRKRAEAATRRAEQALRESEQRLRGIFEGAAVGIVEVDEHDRLVAANDRFCRMLGYARKQILGRTFHDLTAPEDRERTRDLNAHVQTGGLDVFDYEKRYLRSDGAPLWVHVTVSAVRDAERRFVRAVVTVEDITARKAIDAEREQQQRTEASLRRLYDSGIVGVFYWTTAGEITAANDKFLAIVGYDRDDLRAGRIDWARMTPPESEAVDRFALAELRTTGVDTPYEKEYVRKDGSRVAVLVGAAMLDDAYHEGIGYVVDVTERKRSEEALRRSEERFRALARSAELDRNKLAAILEGIQQPVLVTGPDGSFQYMNAAGLAYHGVCSVAELGASFAELAERYEIRDVDGRTVPFADWPLPRAARGERVRDELHVRDRVNGREWSCIYTGGPVHDAAGEVALLVLTIQDLTVQRAREAELRRATIAAEDASRRLREADQRKDEFLGVLSHELRNPLAPIRNSIFLLNRADPSSQQAARARAVIERQTLHMTRLVDDLLDVTRIARGKVDVRRDRVDAVEVVRRTGEDHRTLMLDREITLEVDAPSRPIWVAGDATRLAQIIGNLLQNAAKFTGHGGRVTLAVRDAGQEVEVSVRDDGVGIGPELLPHVFEPFVQAESTLARSSGGLGLGLALVKGLTALHRGSVTVASEGPGKGAEFRVRLPVIESAPEERPTEQPARVRNRYRVLVVDDNHDGAETMAEVVRMFGHEVEVAHDGESAVAKARSFRPDVVLCDIGLPGIDGYEVARMLRADDAVRVRHLVAVSGYAQPEDLRQAAEAGFDRHIAKPPDPADLERLLAG